MSTTQPPPERIPPHSAEAEEAVIASMWIDPLDVVPRVLEAKLAQSSFYIAPNGILFFATVELFAASKPISIATVAEHLKTTNQLATVGGYPYLVAVSEKMPTTAEAAFFINRVKDLATLRALIWYATDIVERSFNLSGDVTSFVSRSVEKLTSLQHDQSEQEPAMSGLVEGAVEYVTQLANPDANKLSTELVFPWPEMTTRFGPMQRGQLIVIAGRTSTGKSSLMRPIALHTATTGHKTYMATLEVQPQQVVMQCAASLCGIGAKRLKHAAQPERDKFMDSLRSLKDAGFTIRRSDRTISQIVGRARILKAKHGLDMLVVDHGGLVQDVYLAPHRDKITAIGRLTKTFKDLATELGIVVILLWQLNRDVSKEDNREPRLSDLRDAGSVEEDADKVLLIHRPSKDPLLNKEQPDTALVKDVPRFFTNVIQAKGRDDGTALLSMYFDRSTASFAPAKAESKPKEGEMAF